MTTVAADEVRPDRRKFTLKITSQILILVFGLAFLLASLGGYSVYVINSIKLQTERLNQVETELEARINSMNDAITKSSGFVTRAALELGLKSSNRINDAKQAEIAMQSFDVAIKSSQKLAENAKSDLDASSELIKMVVKDLSEQKPEDFTFGHIFQFFSKVAVDPEVLTVYSKMITAIDALEGSFREIPRAQKRLEQTVLEYHEFIQTTQLNLYSQLFKNEVLDLQAKVLDANAKLAQRQKSLQDVIKNGSYVNLFREVEAARNLAFASMDKLQTQSLYVTLVIGVASTVFAILFGVLLTTGIRKKLKGANEAVDAIRRGDLTNVAVVDGNDEVSTLLDATEKMREKIVEVISAMMTVTKKISENSTKLHVTADLVSDGTSQQAASVQETSASMDEMTDTINENANNALETDATAQVLAQNATVCSASMQKTSDAMSDIFERIGIVGEITRKIELLALNASVEAARAGEHGKGFAVVASEVSKLAELSKEAASEIERSSTEGKKLADETNKMLDELLPEIEKTQNLVQNISASSKEQSVGAEQINAAIKTLDNVVQKNALAASDLSKSANELAGLVPDLSKLIDQFKVASPANQVSQQDDESKHTEADKPNINAKQNVNQTVKESDFGRY